MALFDSGTLLANVALSDTFNTWRVRTNQINTQAAGLSSNNVFIGDLNTFESINLVTALEVTQGGTEQTTYTNGQLLIGNTTGNTLAKATLTAGTGITVTNGTGTITIAAVNNGTVTSVGGTGTVSGLTLSGTVTSTGNLTLGGTLAVAASNFASQTTKTFLAAPNAVNGVPTFRTILASDVPTLNQNTTGSAATLTTARAINGVNFNGSAAITLPTVNTSGDQTIDGTKTFSGRIRAASYADTVVALGNTGTSQTINLLAGGVFTATLTGNCTFTITNPLAAQGSSFTLVLLNDGSAGRTIAFAGSGASFRFPGGASEIDRTTAANGRDIWVFFTPDGGTTYFGNIAMKDVKA